MTLASYNATKVAYQVKPDWWGTAQLGLNFKFKYLFDVVNGSNNVELGHADRQASIDWSNNFLPGINQLMQAIGGYSFKTFYKGEPYMMSANTAWLEMNTTKAPINNVNFRKAVAYGINPPHIVDNVYSGVVQAANPTGLLPNLYPYLDQSVVKQYGFSYNPAKAKAFLGRVGIQGPEDDPRRCRTAGPTGWPESRSIAQDLKAIGIKVSPIYPGYTARTSSLASGNFDMAIDNNAALDSTPWSYFQRVYNLPIQAQQTAQLNMGTVQLARRLGPGAEGRHHAGERHRGTEDHLQPAREGFPAAAAADPGLVQRRVVPGRRHVLDQLPGRRHGQHGGPVMWRGYLGAMTSIYALAALRPAKPGRLTRPAACPAPSRVRGAGPAGTPLQQRPLSKGASMRRFLARKFATYVSRSVRRDRRLGYPAPDAGRPGPGLPKSSTVRAGRLAGDVAHL